MRIKNDSGYALVMVSVFTLLSSLIAGTYLGTTVGESKNAQHQVDQVSSLYIAESGLQRALYELKTIEDDPNQALPTSAFSINNFKINDVGSAGGANYLGATEMDIYISPKVAGLSYDVTVSASFGAATKNLSAVVRYQPPAKIFDYMYFVNNWGWFYGSTIHDEGDIRSNGDFDLKYNPTVNGEIYAGDAINTHGGQVNGTAGLQDGGGNYYNQHAESSVLEMPNLQDLSVYEELATGLNATIKIGGVTIVDGIYGDGGSEGQNLVLVGTTANPIVIDGPNVIRGDVIIKGVVTGHGTIYAGRNIYAAGNIEYADGPATARPTGTSDADRDTWYTANKDKDIVGFAAKESIIIGDYTGSNGGSWYAHNYLFSMGDEDVGVDGILGTGDTYEGDGIFQAAFEDLDGDGVMDDNYNANDVLLQASISSYDYVPSGVTSLGHIATNYITKLEGIFYTNHAFAGRTGYDMEINGAIISKDEAIIFRDYLTLNYDERVHSRYTKDDPNWLISLGLPSVEDWTIEDWSEGNA